MKITLSKPFSYESKEYVDLTLDIENMTGEDLETAERLLRATGDTPVVPELSKAYQAILAARAAKVSIEMIRALPAKDYSRVTMAIGNFLMQ